MLRFIVCLLMQAVFALLVIFVPASAQTDPALSTQPVAGRACANAQTLVTHVERVGE